MEDHGQDPSNSGGLNQARSGEPVRSRWTPKPEQILTLESIFNSGMVNPPKDETARIRKLLEKFGPVGDANIFYWFQNRRSRSRRRQRQMQGFVATAQAGAGARRNNSTHHENHRSQPVLGAVHPQHDPTSYHVGSSSTDVLGTSLGGEGGAESLFSIPGQEGIPEKDQNSNVVWMSCRPETLNLPYESGNITTFINGIPTEVPRGPIDMKAVFGPDAVLFHRYGVPLPVDESGFLMQSLEHGECYFLVSRRA